MKLNGTTVTGLFQYKPGITYTTDDIIIYNNVMYIVLNEYNDPTTPDKSTNCSNYFDYLADNSGGTSKLVTGSSLQSILQSYYKGLKGDGRITTEPEITNINQLELYNLTGSYHIIIKNELNSVILPGEYVLHVYKFNDVVIQHLISLTLPLQYTINHQYGDSTVSVIGNTESLRAMSEYITLVYNKFKQLSNTYNNNLLRNFEFQTISIALDSDNRFGKLYCDEELLTKDRILHLILQTSIQIGNSEEIQQLPITAVVYPDINITNISITDVDYIKLKFTGNPREVEFELTDQKYTVVSAYVSNGNIH